MMQQKKIFKAGIDVGSTTFKIIVLDEKNQVVFRSYKRHKADMSGIFATELNEINQLFPEVEFTVMITGSAGMGISERLQIPFTQEVVASIAVIKKMYPAAHTVVDLGGEDAKIVFFEQGKQPDIRMNGSCAGGTGAFIDQMADLMNISINELNEQAMQYKKIYPVASRCGVFAKTDVQNLISRNIPLPDVCMSILQTVALQAVTTLMRGHQAKPQVLCIGGPLTFIPSLRKAFGDVLQISDNELILPENSEYFPAWGCALMADAEV